MGARRVLFVEGLGDTEGIDFVGFSDLNWSVVNLHQFFFKKLIWRERTYHGSFGRHNVTVRHDCGRTEKRTRENGGEEE